MKKTKCSIVLILTKMPFLHERYMMKEKKVSKDIEIFTHAMNSSPLDPAAKLVMSPKFKSSNSLIGSKEEERSLRSP
jgi:hypothetical protein